MRPQRVRVTSPRMAARARPPGPAGRSGLREIDEQTGVGEVYMGSLVRTQLRLGLTAISLVVLVLAALPLAFALVPGLAAARVLTVPVPWLVTGVGLYPALVAVARWHVRAVERVERDFAEIVDRHV